MLSIVNNTTCPLWRKKEELRQLFLFSMLLSFYTTAWSFTSGQPTLTLTNTVSVQADGQPVFSADCKDQTLCNLDLNCRPLEVAVNVNNSFDPQLLEVSYRIDVGSNGTFESERPVNSSMHQLPIGLHKIEWIARHRNGKSNSCTYIVEVKDCRTPVPHAINGKSLTLAVDEASVLLLAEDINQFSTDNCSVSELRIFTPSRGPGQLNPPKDKKGLTIELSRYDLGTNSVDLWVKDEAGNWSYTTTYIHLAAEKKIKPPHNTSIYMDLHGNDKRSPRIGEVNKSYNNKLVLFQNEPNPFEQATNIRFYLPGPSPVTLELIDASGKIIKTIRAEYSAGLHTISLNTTDFKSHELILYRLSTLDGVATKKMLRKGA